MLEKCVVSYLSPDSMLINLSKRNEDPKFLVRIWDAVLRGCKVLLPGFQREGRPPVMQMEFSKGDESSELNVLLINM